MMSSELSMMDLSLMLQTRGLSEQAAFTCARAVFQAMPPGEVERGEQPFYLRTAMRVMIAVLISAASELEKIEAGYG